MSYPLNSKSPLKTATEEPVRKYSTIYGQIPDNYTITHAVIFIACSYVMIKMTFFDHMLPAFFVVPIAFYLIYICDNFKDRWNWWEQVTKLRHYHKEIFPYLNEKYQVNLKIRTIGSLNQLLSKDGLQTKNGYVVKLSGTTKYDKLLAGNKNPDKEMIRLSKSKTR